jgi:hypothetical protein
MKAAPNPSLEQSANSLALAHLTHVTANDVVSVTSAQEIACPHKA